MNARLPHSTSSRVPTSSIRRDSIVLPQRPRITIVTHVVILTLALVIWWIARDMVSITRSIPDGARVRVELERELLERWAITSAEILPLSIEVAGPTKEINEFASELDINPGRLTYVYTVTDSDLREAQEQGRTRVTLSLDVSRLAGRREINVPTELNVRPLAREEATVITLERYVSRLGRVDLAGAVTGRLSSHSFEARVQADFELEVRGLASLVEAVTGVDGKARLRVLPADIQQLLDNKAAMEQREVEAILREDRSMVANIQLLPQEGLTVRRIPGGANVAQVPVEITFERLQNFIEMRGTFTVDHRYPLWLRQKNNLRVHPLNDEITVEMEVLSNQRANFNSDNVRVVVDFTVLDEEDLQPEVLEGGLRRVSLTGLFYSLSINREALSYRFKPDVTERNYFPISEVTLEWTE
jgi:hypothetical protein